MCFISFPSERRFFPPVVSFSPSLFPSLSLSLPLSHSPSNSFFFTHPSFRPPPREHSPTPEWPKKPSSSPRPSPPCPLRAAPRAPRPSLLSVSAVRERERDCIDFSASFVRLFRSWRSNLSCPRSRGFPRRAPLLHFCREEATVCGGLGRGSRSRRAEGGQWHRTTRLMKAQSRRRRRLRSRALSAFLSQPFLPLFLPTLFFSPSPFNVKKQASAASLATSRGARRGRTSRTSSARSARSSTPT